MESDKPSSLKTYLGDSVYADIENGMVKLTTENGFGASNTVYMEPVVVANFERWLAKLRETKK